MTFPMILYNDNLRSFAFYNLHVKTGFMQWKSFGFRVLYKQSHFPYPYSVSLTQKLSEFPGKIGAV